jgi:hypothetical protein
MEQRITHRSHHSDPPCYDLSMNLIFYQYILFISLFLVYLTILLVAQTVYHHPINVEEYFIHEL